MAVVIESGERERGLVFVAIVRDEVVIKDGARRQNSPSWFVGDGVVVGEGRGKTKVEKERGRYLCEGPEGRKENIDGEGGSRRQILRFT